VFGAGKIIAVDISDKKLELAKKVGADETVNALSEDPVKEVRRYTDGEYADIVIDFVGLRETIENGIKCVGEGGKLVIVGIGRENIEISPYKTVIGKEMEIIGVNDHLKSELFQLIKLVSNGKIDLSMSITHRISLEEINRGMEILEKNIGDPIRIVAIQ
jgi:threonine dehydrogenase-like Zn-dependent dehydrogenase